MVRPPIICSQIILIPYNVVKNDLFWKRDSKFAHYGTIERFWNSYS